MRSPLLALTWEIWRQKRRSALIVLGCVSFCALVNLVVTDSMRASVLASTLLHTVNGLLMTLSILWTFEIFNYTEFDSAKEWHGFPYRLFVLPVRTWQLVALPLLLGLVAVETVYWAWVKLVLNHGEIPKPEWFAVVGGAYVLFYQTAIWSLAQFRVIRMIVLGVMGTSAIAVACLPFLNLLLSSLGLPERRAIQLLVALAIFAVVTAWAVVDRQRHSGGRRRSWVKAQCERLIDALPRRTRDFASPAAAQFWLEWRRTGWLLPASTAVTLVFGISPITWFNRSDPEFTLSGLLIISVMLLVLAFVVGKGFVKPEFWTSSLDLPSFSVVRPLPTGEMVVAKMKVAALSVAIAWALVIAYLSLWLMLWANTRLLQAAMFMIRTIYPSFWPVVIVMSVAGLMVLTWRCLASGLWTGMSGNRRLYAWTSALQVLAPALLALACGIWSDDIDAAIKAHPLEAMSFTLRVIGWLLALAVLLKLGLAVFAWQQITPRRMLRYLLIWSAATLGFVVLAVLAGSFMDTYRCEHLYVLAAFLLFPLARLGLAPRFLARNRFR